jgi:hypothetical protein
MDTKEIIKKEYEAIFGKTLANIDTYIESLVTSIGPDNRYKYPKDDTQAALVRFGEVNNLADYYIGGARTVIAEKYRRITGRYLIDVDGFIERVKSLLSVEIEQSGDEAEGVKEYMYAYFCIIFMGEAIMGKQGTEVPTMADLERAIEEFKASTTATDVPKLFNDKIKQLGHPTGRETMLLARLPENMLPVLKVDFPNLYRYADPDLAEIFTLKLAGDVRDSIAKASNLDKVLNGKIKLLRCLNLAVEEMFGEGSQVEPPTYERNA